MVASKTRRSVCAGARQISGEELMKKPVRKTEVIPHLQQDLTLHYSGGRLECVFVESVGNRPEYTFEFIAGSVDPESKKVRVGLKEKELLSVHRYIGKLLKDTSTRSTRK
jgi:hypothetical protein